MDAFASMSINYLQDDTHCLLLGKSWVPLGAGVGGRFLLKPFVSIVFCTL